MLNITNIIRIIFYVKPLLNGLIVLFSSQDTYNLIA
jgi:hypothetical protein